MSSLLRTPNNSIEQLQTVSVNKLFLSALDDTRFILEGGIKTLTLGHANAIEATDLETDPKWDAPTQKEIEDLFGEEWETDNESRSTLPASKVGSHPIPTVKDRGCNRLINEPDLDSEHKVDFEAVFDKESQPIVHS